MTKVFAVQANGTIQRGQIFAYVGSTQDEITEEWTVHLADLMNKSTTHEISFSEFNRCFQPLKDITRDII